jgi:hypothetical protein
MIASRYPDYDLLRQALEGWPVLEPVAEVHGTLCGLLAASDLDREAWLTRLGAVKDSERDDRADEDLVDLLTSLHQATEAQLRDPELGFQLCLPGDEHGLPMRAEALAHWCQGFVYGIGLCRLPGSWLGAGETREFLRDLTAISNADAEQTDDDDEEAAFAELVEYVRVGVMLLRAEIDARRQKTAMH